MAQSGHVGRRVPWQLSGVERPRLWLGRVAASDPFVWTGRVLQVRYE